MDQKCEVEMVTASQTGLPRPSDDFAPCYRLTLGDIDRRVIGEETKNQILAREGRLPDAVIACVGGGSNAIGMFADFIEEESVRLIGVEPAGKGIDTDQHGAPLKHGKTGIFFGMN